MSCLIVILNSLWNTGVEVKCQSVRVFEMDLNRIVDFLNPLFHNHIEQLDQ